MTHVIKNFVIGLHCAFEIGGGGCVVQCHLANLLKRRGFNVRVLTTWTNPPELIPPNFIFIHGNRANPTDIDVTSHDTIVIYCEGVEGNPFGAKNVVRWMLSELGKNVPHSLMNSWNKNEVVYYFNGEPKHIREPEKMGNIYKLFSLLYFNPNVKQYNYEPRNKECHTLRKAGGYHKGVYHKHLHQIHSNNSTHIEFDNNHNTTISIFNEYECFYCYDPLTWLAFMAPICGCYTIVHPVEGVDKRTWLSNSALGIYMKEKNIEDLYGIAYGLVEREYAKTTLHLAKQQWDDMRHYFNVTCLDNFLRDMNNFNGLNNRVGNNF